MQLSQGGAVLLTGAARRTVRRCRWWSACGASAGRGADARCSRAAGRAPASVRRRRSHAAGDRPEPPAPAAAQRNARHTRPHGVERARLAGWTGDTHPVSCRPGTGSPAPRQRPAEGERRRRPASSWRSAASRPSASSSTRSTRAWPTDPLLRPLYPEEDLGPAADRLTLFLMQYWGGPNTYSASRGHPRLRMRHAPFRVGPAERDAWLRHMREAVDSLDLPEPHHRHAVGVPGARRVLHGQHGLIVIPGWRAGSLIG